MRNFLRFVGMCLKITFRPARETLDIPSTALGILLPFLQWLKPDYWNSTGGQALMTALWWELPVSIFATVGFVRFLASPYLVYKERDEKAEAKQAQLQSLLREEKAKNEGGLMGSFQQVITGTAIDENGQPCSHLAILFTVTNTGFPSNARGFRLTVHGFGTTISDRSASVVLRPLTISSADGKAVIVVSKENLLFEKTYTHAISSGEERTGWLLYFLKGIDLGIIDAPGVVLEIWFVDIKGKRHATKFTMGPGGDKPLYYPGT